MDDNRRMTADRFFGGIDDRLSTLKDFLEYLQSEQAKSENEGVSETTLTDWILANTDADSRKAIPRHLHFFDTIDLVERNGEQYQIGYRGSRYLSAEDPRTIYDALRSGVKGFDTIVRALYENPMTDADLMRVLVENFEDCNMETPGVAGRHREWLQVLGYIEREDNQNTLTQEGRQLAEEIQDTENSIESLQTTTLENQSDGQTQTATDLSWRKLVRRELERYRRRTGSDIVERQALLRQGKHRFEEAYPDAQTPTQTVSRTLQELRDAGEITFTDDGQYRIESLEFEGDDITVISDTDREILERWADIIADYSQAIHFDLLEHYDPDTARQRARDFIDDPSRERFNALWSLLNSAQRSGSPSIIYEKWIEQKDRTDEELASLIEEILTADEFDSEWQRDLGAKRTLWELFGLLHLEDYPIINGSSERGLAFFGYPSVNSYSRGTELFEDFKVDYGIIVGQASAGTDHEVPANLEIDQLFNVIDKVSEDDVENEPIDEVADLYQLVLRVKRKRGRSQPDHDTESSADQSETTTDRQTSPNYYWVNQNDSEEIEGEFLSSSDKKWQRDLTVLERGDVVFHHHDGQITAYSTVIEEARLVDTEDGERYRVNVDMTWFEEPREVTDFIDTLLRPDIKQDTKYYPITESGRVQQAYLCHLSDPAAEILLEPEQEQTRYFWVTANPSIWSVNTIEQGETVDYTATNKKGNKRRLQSAFDKATPGDRVLFYEPNPTKTIVAEGTITEGLHQSDDVEGYEGPVEAITIRYDQPIDSITWKQLNDVPELEDAAPIANRAQGSLFELSETEFETILALEEPTPKGSTREVQKLQRLVDPIDVDISLPDGLYFEDSDEIRRQIEASLNSGKHIIFTGPPGTGKSKLAKHIAQEATEGLSETTDSNYSDVHDWKFTTATSEWTTFDTIGGYVPDVTNDGSELAFQPRLFLNCFRDENITNRWLVIDEINRSDIDKAFGSLFSVLTGDSVTLPYERGETVEIISLDQQTSQERLEEIAASSDLFPVTPSWRLIATMNTYDKASLYEMSYAFMRRFNFVHIGIPNLETESGLKTDLLNPDESNNFASVWIDQDDAIRPVLELFYVDLTAAWQIVNRYRPIGPSIIKDIVGYMRAYGISGTDEQRTEALTSAIVVLVFPQLEGLRPNEQRTLIRKLGDSSDYLAEERLCRKAADFFDIDFSDE